MREHRTKQREKGVECGRVAWASEQSVVLGQVKCEETSNEITAIPELLKIIEIAGCIVTIDAIGCQKEIVKEIVEKGADYVISLKGNQGNLHKDIKDYLDWAERIGFKEIKYDYCRTLEKGHGRIEERRCFGDGRNRMVGRKRGLEKSHKRDHGRSDSRSHRERKDRRKAIFYQ